MGSAENINMNVMQIKRRWVGVAALASLLAISGTLMFSQSPGKSHTVTVIQLPSPHFTDVSGAAVTQSNYLFAQGITSGCTATTFCPNDSLTRSMAAVLIVRAIYWSINGGAAKVDNFTYTPSPYFTDVPATDPFFKWIQKMKDLEITSGCSETLYCPNDKVQNIQIAIFAARARQFLETGKATPKSFSFNSTPYFGDETAASDPTNFPYVQRAGDLKVFSIFATPAVSAGCRSGNFCAANYTTRAQALPYIVRGIMGEVNF
jgi:hypothetical protein